MNRQTLMIGAALTAAVVVVLGILIVVERDETAGVPAPVTGPGRAEEARGIIAEIEAERAEEGAARPPAQARTLESAATPRSEPVEGGAVAETPAPVADSPTGAGAELDSAFERARSLQAAGQLDDAQVLFFFGARQGHAPSAFAYAQMNDPNHHSPETSLLDEPDAFQAFRWYTTALEGGMTTAAERLDALHVWAIEAAAAGDGEAERLLLQWE